MKQFEYLHTEKVSDLRNLTIKQIHYVFFSNVYSILGSVLEAEIKGKDQTIEFYVCYESEEESEKFISEFEKELDILYNSQNL